MIQAEALGFSEDPFSELPDPRYTYRHRAFQAVCADLLYARMSERQGFTIVTGSEGSGKTALLQMLHEERASADRYHTFAAHRKLTLQKLLQQAIEVFGIVSHEQVVETDSEECFEFLKDYVLETSQEGGRVIFLIDRAESLTRETLAGMTELAYLGEGDGRLLQLILAVRTEAGSRELPRSFRDVAHDVAFQFHLGPLGPLEIEPYLRYRMEVGGYEGADLFDQGAMDELAEISGGNPLRINRLARTALQVCQAEGWDRAGAASVAEAAEQCGYDGPPPHEPGLDDDEDPADLQPLPLKPLRWSIKQPGSTTADESIASLVDDEDEETVFQWPRPGPAAAPGDPIAPLERPANATRTDRPETPDTDPASPEAGAGDERSVEFDLDQIPRSESDAQSPQEFETGAPETGALETGALETGALETGEPVAEVETADRANVAPQSDEEILRLWEQARGTASSADAPRWRLANLRSGPNSVWRTRLYATVGILCIGAVVFWIGGGEDKASRTAVQISADGFSEEDAAEPVTGAADDNAQPDVGPPEANPAAASQASPAEPTIVWESDSASQTQADDAPEATADSGDDAISAPGSQSPSQTTDEESTAEISMEERLAALDEDLAQVVTRLEALSTAPSSGPESPAAGEPDQAQAAAQPETAQPDTAQPVTAQPGDTAPAAAEIESLKAQIAGLAADLASLQEARDQLAASLPVPTADLEASPPPADQEAGQGSESQAPADPAAADDSQPAAIQQAEAAAQFAVLLPSPMPKKSENRIADLQSKLNALGYKIGHTNGSLSARTKRAIEKYQRDHGLLTDGAASRELVNHVSVFAGLKDAIVRYHEGDLEAAAANYDQILQLQPGDHETRLLRALVYLRLGETDSALRDIAAAKPALSGDQGYAFYRPGRIYYIQERLKELGFNPGRQDGMMVRQSEDAIIAFERKHGLPSSGQPTIELLKYVEVQSQHNRAIGAYQRGDLLKALELYHLVVAMDPEDAEAYFNRGLTYKVLGHTTEALADYERAAALNPGLSKVHYDRGNIRWHQGRYKDALADYWWAIRSWW